MERSKICLPILHLPLPKNYNRGSRFTRSGVPSFLRFSRSFFYSGRRGIAWWPLKITYFRGQGRFFFSRSGGSANALTKDKRQTEKGREKTSKKVGKSENEKKREAACSFRRLRGWSSSIVPTLFSFLSHFGRQHSSKPGVTMAAL